MIRGLRRDLAGASARLSDMAGQYAQIDSIFVVCSKEGIISIKDRVVVYK